MKSSRLHFPHPSQILSVSRLLPLVLLFALLVGCKDQPQEKQGQQPAQKIRIVSWNLNWFPGRKDNATEDAAKKHMAEAQTALKELKPDILLLQEVRDWQAAQELCSVVPGLHVQVVSRFQPRPQNQVIATNLPVDSTWSADWDHKNDGPPRGYTFAAIELPGKRFLLTYSLHLKSNVGAPVPNVMKRQESAKQLLRHTEEMLDVYSPRGGCFFIVAGDMNTSLDDPKFEKEKTLHAIIGSGFRWTFDGVPFVSRVTHPKDKYPDACFDHIFTLGLGKQTASVHPYPGISDHNPVVLDLVLPQTPVEETLDVGAGLKLLKSAPPAEPEKEIIVTATLNADDQAGILAAVGKVVAVRGKVNHVGKTRSGSIQFINFQKAEKGPFIGIVKRENLEAVEEALGGALKSSLSGKTVELRGEIILYGEVPEIIVTSGNQIHLQK